MIAYSIHSTNLKKGEAIAHIRKKTHQVIEEETVSHADVVIVDVCAYDARHIGEPFSVM